MSADTSENRSRNGANPFSGREFSPDQKEYLDGFLRALSGPPAAGDLPPAPRDLGHAAQLAWMAGGKRLSKEEQIKFESNPLDAFEAIERLSRENKLPEGADVFRLKFHGLFNVSPAQEAMMCRLRIPGGALTASQLKVVADCAERYGSGAADITTRANFQIREIKGGNMLSLLEDLHSCGIIPRGAGADNIRNVTGSATAGFGPDELIDVLPLCRRLHHHILNHREYYGLPRKFNIAFEGGGAIPSLEDTNDIGFRAVRIPEGEKVPAGVYFRVALGGITGHKDFARDTGLMLTPDECIPAAMAMVRVFIAHGDRNNRKKARLKYLLDSWGFEKFLSESEREAGGPFRRFPLERCLAAVPAKRDSHLGVHPQKQGGLRYLGVDVPVGRLTSEQMRVAAAVAERFGGGEIRLTVWQNLLIPHVPEARVPGALTALAAAGLSTEPDPVSAGLVACTGSEGCKFGQAPTKGTALRILSHLKGRLALDAPVNIHLTGCPHSCAQHFIGDIGLLATTVETDGVVQGAFHVLVGGGYDRHARMAIPCAESVPATEIPAFLESMLGRYLEKRNPGESFSAFARRLNPDEMISTLLPETSGVAHAA